MNEYTFQIFEQLNNIEKKVNFLYLSKLEESRDKEIIQAHKDARLMKFKKRAIFFAEKIVELNSKYPELKPLK